VDFAGRTAADLLRSCGLAPGRVAQVHPPSALQALFDELIICGLRATRKSTALCESLLECLALKLADARTPATGAEALSFSTYEHCQRHLQQHFRRLRTLEQVAEECHVNAAYLCRLYRRYSHQSPYQQLLRLKMNFAAELLQHPDALVKTIAAQAGFGDPFHFSRAFKSVLGLSPEAFRRLRGRPGRREFVLSANAGPGIKRA
jgi:AraC-like DNA-binding protein